MRLGRTRFTIYSPAIGDQLLKHEAYGTSTVRVSEISTLTNYRAEKNWGVPLAHRSSRASLPRCSTRVPSKTLDIDGRWITEEEACGSVSHT